MPRYEAEFSVDVTIDAEDDLDALEKLVDYLKDMRLSEISANATITKITKITKINGEEEQTP